MHFDDAIDLCQFWTIRYRPEVVRSHQRKQVACRQPRILTEPSCSGPTITAGSSLRWPWRRHVPPRRHFGSDAMTVTTTGLGRTGDRDRVGLSGSTWAAFYPNRDYRKIEKFENRLCSGQSYEACTIVNYDSRVVPDLKIPHITTLES